MPSRYNLHEICKLMKMSCNDIEDNDISRLNYLIDNLHFLDGECLLAYSFVVNVEECSIIYNPAQILQENNHLYLADCLSVDCLERFVKNTVLTIYKYHI